MMKFLSICLTSLVSYLVLFFLTKLMGHKQISQLDFFDYITAITIGSIAAEFATELETPWKPLTSMLIYAGATFLLGVVVRKFPCTRKYLNGTSKIIMKDGKINRKNLKKAKLDLNEFLVMCRQQGYFDLGNIHTALFEYNGKLTILPASPSRPATPKDLQLQPEQETPFAEIIMDGKILDKNLQHMGFDRNWLAKQLQQQNIASEKDVVLGLCDRSQHVYFYQSEEE